MSWFWRGFQSAIFYYVSCAPCSKLGYRRKRRKEYKLAKAQKALHDLENGEYEHPSPFSTNPYWREEIAIGPGPPDRKAVRDGKAKPEKDPAKERERRLHTGGLGSSTDTGVSSADTIVESEAAEQIRNSGEGWNKRRYQRADEVLWGMEEQETQTSVGMTPVSRTGSGSKYQYYARNPAINDLHPPVVSTRPRDKTETLWMLQPPPKAKLMEGKERGNTPPNRSRSGSGGTNASKASMGRVSDISLGRQVSQRLMESKLKRGEQQLSPPESAALSRGPSTQGTKSAAAPGQPHDRDTSLVPPRKNQETPPPPASLPSDTPLPELPPPRPPLSTVPSASLPQKQKDRPPHLRPILLSTGSASSLRILQELVAPASQLNTIKGASDALPSGAVQVKLPPVSHQEDIDLGLPELDGRFPEAEWGLRGGKIENARPGHVHRWSMDI
ncbi:hypothetical protein P7C71_g3022, partial [Lecanoromycetidae sp. Uapishka_2]